MTTGRTGPTVRFFLVSGVLCHSGIAEEDGPHYGAAALAPGGSRGVRPAGAEGIGLSLEGLGALVTDGWSSALMSRIEQGSRDTPLTSASCWPEFCERLDTAAHALRFA